MPAHVADCSPGVRKILKSLWEVEAVSPGVADHMTLGITVGAGLVAVRVAVVAAACAPPRARCGRVRARRPFREAAVAGRGCIGGV